MWESKVLAKQYIRDIGGSAVLRKICHTSCWLLLESIGDMTQLDVGEFLSYIYLGYFVCQESVSGGTLLFALCFIWPRRGDGGFGVGAIRGRRLEMEGVKTKETIHCLSLSQKPLESQCHLQLHYWTIWEVVQFRGFFLNLGFFAGFFYISLILPEGSAKLRWAGWGARSASVCVLKSLNRRVCALHRRARAAKTHLCLKAKGPLRWHT